ncbi:putative lipid II flippase FtsW [Candidatus Entotheonella palauensis]|uniref:putative lipid II flippase FtsW n=1 Tax=Candidatus Entotheonella palauensis TaxID=93172 RepID=UPI000B7FE40C|nr:putative lipid II flippase FtsW [Candidatus Entotheonella palauensis]
MTKTRRTDVWLLMATLMLVAIGLAMVYSTSAVVAHERHGDSLYFLKRQLAWAALGLLAMGAAWYVPYRNQQRLVLPWLLVSLVALGLVLVPGIGREVGGARRWLALGPFTLQPSEFAKYGLIVYSAYLCADLHGKRQRDDRRFGYMLVLVCVFCGLIFLQPDLGTAVVLAGAVGVHLMIAGLPWRYIRYALAVGIPAIIYAIVYEPYRMKRLMSFLQPESDPQGAGYQAIQSLLALGRGGLWGAGLGRGRQKLFYLPEAHTDFIFAAIGEELGFLGAVGLIGLFVVLLWRILAIAIDCREPFGTLLGLGIFLLLGIQIIMNLGVVLGLLPTKGLPLPLISLGGSNLVVSLLAIGTVLSIAGAQPRREPWRHATPGKPAWGQM